MVGLLCCRNTRGEVTFTFVMVFSARVPGVIHEFVIVPHGDHWVISMQSLKVRIGAVQAVTHAVVLERNNFGARLYSTTELLDRNGVGINAVGVFIDVVTQMQHHI